MRCIRHSAPGTGTLPRSRGRPARCSRAAAWSSPSDRRSTGTFRKPRVPVRERSPRYPASGKIDPLAGLSNAFSVQSRLALEKVGANLGDDFVHRLFQHFEKWSGIQADPERHDDQRDDSYDLAHVHVDELFVGWILDFAEH